MRERIFEGRLAERAAKDPARREQLKALAREVVVIIRQGLVEDGMVRIHGFGTFRLTRGKPRTTTNPQTGEKMTVPARNRVSFRPAKALRERIEPGATDAIPLAEPMPSREAALGGAMLDDHAAGRLPDKDRTAGTSRDVAAARMAEPVISTGEPTAPPQPAPPPEEPDDRAADSESGPASATTREEPPWSEEPDRDDMTRRDVEEHAQPMPAASAMPAGAHAPAAAGPTSGRDERRRPVALLLVMLLVVIAALAWWLWPRGLDIEPVELATAPEETTVEPIVTGPEQLLAESELPSDAMPSAGADEDAPPAVNESAETGDTPAMTERVDPVPVEETPPLAAPPAAEDTPVPETVPDSLAAAEAADRATAEQLAAEPATASGQAFFEGRTYEVSAGDTLWGLADRNYVNPFFWPHIYNRNGEITNPDQIWIGQEITLPTLQGDPRALTAEDRQSIAEGYLRLYEFWRREGHANAHYALIGVQHFDGDVLPADLAAAAARQADDPIAALFAVHSGDAGD